MEGPTVTRGEQMLALRKRRMAATHPFLRGGFRPFFLGAPAWGVIALALWLCEIAEKVVLPTVFEGVAWHRHEMLFGFVGAAVAGFLLTAIPNWTGRLPIAGRPLLALFGLWAAARFAVLFSGVVGFWTAAILDAGFFLSLAFLAAREVLASKNRNMPIVGMVFVFGVMEAADYAVAAGAISGGIGWRGAIALVIVMISLIGGRIIPSFTRNWMVKKGQSGTLPTQPQSLDLLVIAATAVAMLFWLGLSGQPADWARTHPGGGRSDAPALALARLANRERPVGAHSACRLRLGSDRTRVAGPVCRRPEHSPKRRNSRSDRRCDDDHDPGGDEPGKSGPYRTRAEGLARD